LTFNKNKSYCIVVGPRNYYKLAEVCVDGNALKWTNSIRYLGVDIKSWNVFTVNWEQVRKYSLSHLSHFLVTALVHQI